jgi:hypothetical protein
MMTALKPRGGTFLYGRFAAASLPPKRNESGPAEVRAVFGSLDYIYLPAADVDGEVLRNVKTMGAELVASFVRSGIWPLFRDGYRPVGLVIFPRLCGWVSQSWAAVPGVVP